MVPGADGELDEGGGGRGGLRRGGGGKLGLNGVVDGKGAVRGGDEEGDEGTHAAGHVL